MKRRLGFGPAFAAAFSLVLSFSLAYHYGTEHLSGSELRINSVVNVPPCTLYWTTEIAPGAYTIYYIYNTEVDGILGWEETIAVPPGFKVISNTAVGQCVFLKPAESRLLYGQNLR